MSDDARRRDVGRPRHVSEIPLARARALDRNSQVPLYYQLAEVLRQALEADKWPPHSLFPSERELEEAFGVSRAVTRRALDLLVGDGAIVRVKGSGTFVAPPKHRIAVEGLLGTLLEKQADLELSVLSTGAHSPESAPAELLQIAGPGGPLTRVTALVSIAARPAYYIDSYASPLRIPWLLGVLDRGEADPRSAGLELTRMQVSIDGSHFGPWAASRLGVSPGDPVLIGTMVQFGRLKPRGREEPLEFARFLWPSDSTQLSISTERRGRRAPARRTP
ncbi:MAG TPA: GntR family transcriptional regulator [Solirubrobacterales bacterium]|jgi:GntR family transcriptional regulator|nr:GntR family transcriptional regulator [Solirubrobacterales bacterium]